MRLNVPTSEWGEAGWAFLDACARGVDGASVQFFSRLAELLPDVLPCEKCRRHAGQYLSQHPVDTGDPVGWLRRFRSFATPRHRGGAWGLPAALALLLIGAALLAPRPKRLFAGRPRVHYGR